MKTINKIFMAIAVIILTPTVMLVAFILVADATDMDLESMVWEVGTETETALLAEGETAGSETAAGENAEVPPAEAVPPEGEASYENAGEAPSDGNNLAANPPANWTPTANNGAIQQQLNMDAWNANPTTSTGTDSTANTKQVNEADVAAYVKAMLDLSYKNDSSGYVTLGLGSEEEATELYETGIDLEMLEFYFTSGATEEQSNGVREKLCEILAKARYTVGEVKKQNDGSYEVTIAYEQLNVFVPAVETYSVKAKNMVDRWDAAAATGRETPAGDEMYGQLISTFVDCLTESLATATYDAPLNTTVRVRVSGGEYLTSDEDFAKLEYVLFDIEKEIDKLNEIAEGWDFY